MVASEWIGSPLELMLIVTRPACDEEPPMCATDVTSPTSTPAIRTGEGMCSCVSDVTIAFSWYGVPANGEEPPNTK